MQLKHHDKSQYEPVVVHECAVWHLPRVRENVKKKFHKKTQLHAQINLNGSSVHSFTSHSCVYCMCVYCNSPWQCVYSLWLCVWLIDMPGCAVCVLVLRVL